MFSCCIVEYALFVNLFYAILCQIKTGCSCNPLTNAYSVLILHLFTYAYCLTYINILLYPNWRCKQVFPQRAQMSWAIRKLLTKPIGWLLNVFASLHMVIVIGQESQLFLQYFHVHFYDIIVVAHWALQIWRLRGWRL